MIHEKVNGSHAHVAAAAMKRAHRAHKPRPVKASLARLSPDKLEEVYEWFRENLTYKEIAARAAEKWGVKLSATSLSEYYHKRSVALIDAGSAENGRARAASCHVVNAQGPSRITITVMVEPVTSSTVTTGVSAQ